MGYWFDARFKAQVLAPDGQRSLFLAYRGLGRIWETRCTKKTWVCKMLARYARNSFIFIFASFAAPKTFLAQLFKKPKKCSKKKNLKKIK